MDKFIGETQLPKIDTRKRNWKKEEKRKYNYIVCNLKSPPKKTFPYPSSFNGEFWQMFKKEKNANAIQILPEHKEKAMLPNCSWGQPNLSSKLDKNMIKKGKL